MSKAEGFRILEPQNAETVGAKKLRPQSVVRKKLADISNLPQNQKLLIQEEKSQSIETTAKEHIKQLQKDNMALVNMLAQRNKIIEQSGIELDRLRLNLLKMQEQNQQLALSNTQMLAELNSGKDRLKVLQHELGCKSFLLKARELDVEGRARTKPCKNVDVELNKSREEEESSKEGIDDEKPHRLKRSLQSNGIDSGSSEQLQSENKTENKRPFVRRQSARFKTTEVKPAEDPLETDNTKVSACQLPDDTVRSISESALVKNEDNTVSSGRGYESQEFGRTSLCRPSRAAAKKGQSYKEFFQPVNVKMRRPQ